MSIGGCYRQNGRRKPLGRSRKYIPACITVKIRKSFGIVFRRAHVGRVEGIYEPGSKGQCQGHWLGRFTRHAPPLA
jgi:hypothetical protein